MKLKDILIVLIIAAALIGIDKYFSKKSIIYSNTNEQNKILSSESISGTWSFEGYQCGKLYLQFEKDGTLRIYSENNKDFETRGI